MSDGLKISEHIYSHTLFGDKCEFSGFGTLTEFFSSVPQAVQERWPFDLSDKGYRTFYEQALVVSEQLGFVSDSSPCPDNQGRRNLCSQPENMF